MASVIAKLGDQFTLNDKGSLHFFFGVEVIPTCESLFLSQHKNVRDLLKNTNMIGANDVSTPFSTTTSLHLVDGTAVVDSNEFRHVIDSLQYLPLTCSDISFVVNKSSQFMHETTFTHWTTIKRLLQYLKQTIFHGIQLKKSVALYLTTYSDADWVGNIDDPSTSTYITFLGSNPIS